MPLLDDIKNKTGELADQAKDGIKGFASKHPDASRALLAALVSGGVGGGMSAMSRREFNETRGQKRMRTVRNALLAAGLGGGAVAALQAGGHQFANAVPAEAEDPVAAGITRGRELAGGAATSLPVQLYGAHKAIQMHDGPITDRNPHPKDRALDQLKSKLQQKMPPLDETGFESWLRGHADPSYRRMANVNTSVFGEGAILRQAKNEFLSSKDPAMAGLQKALASEAPNQDVFRQFMNKQFNGHSVFDKNHVPGSVPHGMQDQVAVQNIIKTLGEQSGGGLQEMKSLMRRSGVNYSNHPVGGIANRVRGFAENLGLTKHPSAPGVSARARGAAGLAGSLLIPGLVSNLMKGEFNARDYLPDIPFVGHDDPFAAATN